jgi:hypothetical protein
MCKVKRKAELYDFKAFGQAIKAARQTGIGLFTGMHVQAEGIALASRSSKY